MILDHFLYALNVPGDERQTSSLGDPFHGQLLQRRWEITLGLGLDADELALYAAKKIQGS